MELLDILPHQKVVEDSAIVAEVRVYSVIPCFDRLAVLKKAVADLGLANKFCLC